MCSEYTIKSSQQEIEEALEAVVSNLSENTTWDKRVKLTTKAPIIFKNENDKLCLDEYVFPLKPQWNSRLSGSDKFDEEGIKRIYDLKSWKEPFEKTPCLIPMSSFIEPVYWGEKTGTAQAFSIEEEPFFVAGLRFKATMPSTDRGFSLITHTPTKQMLEFHRRLLVILPKTQALEYLETMDKHERFEYLINNRYKGSLKVVQDRKLSPSTVKRNTAERLAELDEEILYMQKLKAEGIEG